jgi:hypothetical protein
MRAGRFFLLAAVFITALAGAPALSFSADSPASLNPGSVAGAVAALFPSFKSYVVKVDGPVLYITSPEWGELAAGGFFEVTDGSGARLAVAKIKTVEDKSAVCEIVWRSEEIRPGKSYARGFKSPLRMLWLWDKTADGTSAIFSIEEALRDRGMFDLVPPLYSMALSARAGNEGVAGFGAQSETWKSAQALKADMVATASVKDGRVSVTVFLAGGERLAEITAVSGPLDEPAQTAGKKGEGETDETAESIFGAVGHEKTSFVFKKWSGAGYPVAQASSKVMDVRERARWKKHTVDGVALSAVPLNGGRVLIVFSDVLRLVRPDGDKLATLWEMRAPSGAKLVSAASADIDGDGVSEVFVNAVGNEGLRSFALKVTAETHTVIADGMNYYFSSSKGGAALAQRGAEGAPLLDGETFTVVKSGNDLSFIPAFTIKDKDVPVGLARVDLNGDNVAEAVGVNSKGALVVYSQSGEAAWKSPYLGLTGRNLYHLGDRSVPAPPRVLPVMDNAVGLTLAVAGAEYERGGFFGGAKLAKGSIRFVSVKEGACVEEDRISAPEGWISDLIEPLDSGDEKDSAPGFIRVLPGTLGDKSDIFLPIK